MKTTTFKYQLDKTSKKFNCPQCRQKRFVRTVDNETGEYLPDHVGRCDRESHCGYEYTWKQWLRESNGESKKSFIDSKVIEQPKPVEYLPFTYMERSLQRYEQNNLYLFLVSLFGHEATKTLCKKYFIGTTAHWKGGTVYWQVDHDRRVRQCKLMLYNPELGKRIKAGATIEQYNRSTGNYETITTDRPCSKVYGQYISDSTRYLNLEQCFFGQHLLAEHPYTNVCVAESEKTALIASVYYPQYIWLATGGASGCKWREYSIYKVLENRSVTFFPDYGFFNKKTGKTCHQEWCERVGRIAEVLLCKIRVSDLLEKSLAHLERVDQELADLLLIRDRSSGLALAQAGYPVIWDNLKA
jgi:hypothetical protein